MASGPAVAQGAWEWQAQGLMTFATGSGANLSSERMIGGGLGLGRRTDGRLRALVSINAGDLEGRFAVRPEASVVFLLNPYKTRGLTPFAGGGLAILVAGAESAEYLLVRVGVESSPGGTKGWFVEGGVGGGVRLSAGIRGRWPRRAG